MNPLKPGGMSRQNNFDLLRLFAAMQVVVWHLNHYQNVAVLPQLFYDITKYFPGVIVFFVISGFLIFASFDRNPDLGQYFKNRALRIFPALWVASIILFALMFFAGYLRDFNFSIFKWMFGQLTVFQHYRPAGIGEYSGGNAPNPSLWTIPIEFSFYVFVPILFWMVRKTKVISMTAFILFFLLISLVFNYYLMTIRYENKTLYLTLTKNLLPYLLYFLLGALSYLYYDRLKKLYIGKGFYWLAVYIAYAAIAGAYLDSYEPHYFTNGFGFIGTIILSQTVIAFAYTNPGVSHKLLRGNDISYGVYLYHMLIINVFNRNGFNGNNYTFIPVILLTIGMAYMSWIFIEKPAMSLKNKRLFRVGSV